MKEDRNKEWKESWRDEYLKALCGFANAEGGCLIVGKNDNGQDVGVSNADRLMEDLPNKIRDLLGIMPPELTPARLFRKHPSLPANPDVANAFFRAGMIEAWGDGYERIVDACHATGNPKPKVRCEAQGIWLEFAFPEEYLKRVSGNRESTGEVGAKSGPSWDQVTTQTGSGPESGLESIARRVLGSVAAHPLSKSQIARSIGHKSISGKLNIRIREMLATGLIEYTVPNKPRSRLQKYRLTPKGRALLDAKHEGAS